MAGSAFVTCQYWTSSVFTVEIAGTANALAAGWGNLGGGVAQIVMGSLLFPLFRIIYGGRGYKPDASQEATDESEARACELAWRTVFIFPAIFCFLMAWAVVRFADDTPKGNIRERRRHNLVENVSVRDSLKKGAVLSCTWLLFLQYGCCFGVEITMTNAAALYFKDEFGLSTESAAAIASIFGWMNLFARGIGGFCGDMANAKSGMRGRLVCQLVFLLLEGSMVIAFAYTSTLAAAIVVMVIFSTFVQAAEGITYGIVPYVSPDVTGSVAGIVGAGGNVGGIGFALLFRGLDYQAAFLWMGFVVVVSALLTVFIRVPGHRGLFWGKDSPEVLEHRRLAKLPAEITIETG